MDKYEKFKTDILRLTGLDLSSYKEKQMKRRINSLISKNGFLDFDDYLLGLKTDKKLYLEFINYVTINVTEFFRNYSQWESLETKILPILLKNKNHLKIWSSACSTGEEPYSLAMLLNEVVGKNNYEIIASDIDEAVLNKAKEGIYNAKNLNNIPLRFKKYFNIEKDIIKVNNELKNNITFKKINLLSDNFPKECDLILCRNVMIYFTDEAKINLYKKFNKSLTKNGIFFVGSTEQIILPKKYNFNTIETFFYQKISV